MSSTTQTTHPGDAMSSFTTRTKDCLRQLLQSPDIKVQFVQESWARLLQEHEKDATLGDSEDRVRQLESWIAARFPAVQGSSSSTSAETQPQTDHKQQSVDSILVQLKLDVSNFPAPVVSSDIKSSKSRPIPSSALAPRPLFSSGLEDIDEEHDVGPTEQDIALIPHHLRRKRPYERLSLAQMYFWSVDGHGESGKTMSSANVNSFPLPFELDLAISEAQAAEFDVIDLDIRLTKLTHSSKCPHHCPNPSCDGLQALMQKDFLAQLLSERETHTSISLVQDFRDSMATERQLYRRQALNSVYTEVLHKDRIASEDSVGHASPSSWKGQLHSFTARTELEQYDALVVQWVTACNEVVIRRSLVEKMLTDIVAQQDLHIPLPTASTQPKQPTCKILRTGSKKAMTDKHGILLGQPPTDPPKRPLPVPPKSPALVSVNPAIPDTPRRPDTPRPMLTAHETRRDRPVGPNPSKSAYHHARFKSSPAELASVVSSTESKSLLAPSASVSSTAATSPGLASPAPKVKDQCSITPSSSSTETVTVSGALDSTSSQSPRLSDPSHDLVPPLCSPKSEAQDKFHLLQSPTKHELPRGKSLKRKSKSSITSIPFTVRSMSPIPSLPPMSDVDGDDTTESISDTSTLPGLTEWDMEIVRMRRRLGQDVIF